MSKRLIVPISVLVLLALLSGACAPITPPAPTGDAPAGTPFRIALILPTPKDDYSWSQSMFHSLRDVQARLGGPGAVEVDVRENVNDPAAALQAVREFAGEGYDLVIAHSAVYGGPAFLDAARAFPATSFAWPAPTNVGAEAGVDNVFAYVPPHWEAGYLNGIAAAVLSDADTVGVVVPGNTFTSQLLADGIAAGVKAVEPETAVNIINTADFFDADQIAEAVRTAAEGGSDVVTGMGPSTVAAVQAARDAGVYWIGIFADQSPLAPEHAVLSQHYEWAPALEEMIAAHQGGKPGGEIFTLSLANGGHLPVYNARANVPMEKLAAVKAAVEAAIQGIRDGHIAPAR
jgi:basic membrane protein A